MTTALDLIESLNESPNEVGDSFTDRETTHGSRVDETLDGLLTNGGSNTSGGEVGLGEDSNIRNGGVERTTALDINSHASRDTCC